MAYYVDEAGAVHPFRVSGPDTIRLENGTELKDEPRLASRMFATWDAAATFAGYVRENPETAVYRFKLWLRDSLEREQK